VAFLLITNTDITFFKTIYCHGLEDQVSNTTQPINIPSPDNTPNIPSTNPTMSPNTNSSKIELEPEKYYHVRKDTVAKLIEIAGKAVEVGVEKVVANVGAATAGGTAASTILKSKLPLGPKIAIAGASAAVVAASTKIGITLGENLLTKGSGNANTALDRTPSPTDFYVPSVLDPQELLSPLEELIKNQLILNFLILFLIVILIVLLFNKMFLSNNIFVSYIKRFLNKDLVLKFDSYRMKIEKFNAGFFFLFFGINAFTLLFDIFLNIIISCELTFDLDYYLRVHDEIKNSFCTLFTMYLGLGNSGLPPKNKQKPTNKQKQKKQQINKKI
jgi:hypothetical protein